MAWQPLRTPSTYADGGKAAATPPADVNHQILAQLIGMNTAITHLLELDRAKAAAATH